MEIEGKKCISHKVKITTYFEGILHIPEEMDALDLKALTQQANQIFKMSQAETNIVTQNEDYEEPVKKKRKYKKRKSKSKVDVNKIIELHKQGFAATKIKKKTGYAYKQVYYSLKRNGFTPLLVNGKQPTNNKKIRKPILVRKPGDVKSIEERYKLLVEYYQCVDTIDRERFAKRNNLNLLQFQKATTSWKAQTGFKG